MVPLDLFRVWNSAVKELFSFLYIEILIIEIDVKLLDVYGKMWYNLPCGGDYHG